MKSFLRQLVLAEEGSKTALTVVLAILFAGLSVWVYRVAHTHAETVNTDVRLNDQHVYLDYAEILVRKGFDEFLPRQRMPLYFYFLTLFHEDGMSLEAFFEKAKHVNIIVTIALILILFFFSRRFLPVAESVLMSLTPGLLVFAFKAGYAQPETMLMTIVLISTVLLVLMLRRPGWPLAVVTAISLALWQYTKSSATVALLLFCTAYALKYLWTGYRDQVWREKQRVRGFAETVAMGILVPVLFLALFYPYARDTREVFGSWFYSVHTRYIFWCDTPEEKRQTQLLKLAMRPPPPEISPDELPGPARYWREHSLKKILERPIDGAVGQLHRIDKHYHGFARVFQVYFWAAIITALLRRRKAVELVKEYFFEILFCALFFLAYMTLCGWWDPLKLGARIVLALSLPPLFFLVYWVYRVTCDWDIPFRGHRISARKIVNLIAAVVLAQYAWEALTVEIFEVYKGG